MISKIIKKGVFGIILTTLLLSGCGNIQSSDNDTDVNDTASEGVSGYYQTNNANMYRKVTDNTPDTDVKDNNISVSNIITYIPSDSGMKDENTLSYNKSIDDLAIVPESLGCPSHNGRYFADWYGVSLAGYKGLSIEISYPDNIGSDPKEAYLNNDTAFTITRLDDIEAKEKIWEVYAETNSDDDPFVIALFNTEESRQYVSFTVYMADGIKADDMTADLAERLINAI